MSSSSDMSGSDDTDSSGASVGEDLGIKYEIKDKMRLLINIAQIGNGDNADRCLNVESIHRDLLFDKDVLVALVKEDYLRGDDLRRALAGNRQLTVCALINCGELLGCVDDEMRDDEFIVALAVGKSRVGCAFKFASDRLKNDVEFIKQLIVYANIHIVMQLSDKLRDDDDLMMFAVSEFSSLVQYASLRLLDSLEMAVCLAYGSYGCLFIGSMSARVRNNSAIMYLMVCERQQYDDEKIDHPMILRHYCVKDMLVCLRLMV